MFKTNPIEAKLDEEILSLLATMEGMKDKESAQYAVVATQLQTLYKLRKEGAISADTWATIIANAAGIVIILSHERTHVIASKAIGFVKKLF